MMSRLTIANDFSCVNRTTGYKGYQAPEVQRQERCTDKVDVWSFGAILHTLLTAEGPTNGAK